MNPMNAQFSALADGIFEAVKGFLLGAIAPLAKRLDQVESEIPGLRKSITAEAIAPLLREEVKQAVALIPPPRDGIQGPPGKGIDGRDGEPGRDALQIDILPAIDLSRSYPRATYAQHRGGLVRSLRTTEPVVGDDLVAAGWSFILRGIDSETEECLDHGRIIRRVTVYSDGTKLEREHKTSVQIYRGVYREGDDYERGDTTTFGGGTWHCNVSGTKRKPGEVGSDDWTLQAKRGRDGKDGVVIEPKQAQQVRLGK